MARARSLPQPNRRSARRRQPPRRARPFRHRARAEHIDVGVAAPGWIKADPQVSGQADGDWRGQMTSGIGPASVLKARENLTGKQARRFSVSGRRREVWRACTLKEALRGIFEHGLTVRDVTGLIGRFI